MYAIILASANIKTPAAIGISFIITVGRNRQYSIFDFQNVNLPTDNGGFI